MGLSLIHISSRLSAARLAYRMFQLEPKAEYFDILERMMLNTNLAALSLDGKRFFYENMLRRAKELDYKLIWPLTLSLIHISSSDFRKHRGCYGT